MDRCHRRDKNSKYRMGVHSPKKVHCQTYTIMNKITGALLFLLPLTFKLVEIRYCAIAVCFIATAAAIQEGFCIRKEIRA